MRILLLFIVPLVACWNVAAQGRSFSSVAEVVVTHSQNGRYFLKSVPHDNITPSVRGTTSVFEAGKPEPLYTIPRGFDSVDGDSNNLVLSDDGRTVLHALPWGADEKLEELRSVTIYRDGKLLRSYTMEEVTGCDARRERCDLVYSNFDEVVDRAKSRTGTPQYKKVLKSGVSESERFLSDFAIFAHDGIVYITDSKLNTHLFDLVTGEKMRTVPFEKLFPEIKSLGRFYMTELTRFNVPMVSELPNMKDGSTAHAALGRYLGMTPASGSSEADEQYRLYTLKVSGTVRRDGTFEVEGIEMEEGLPRDKVQEFFRVSKFDPSTIPAAADRWYIDDDYLEYRKTDPALARKEKKEELIRRKEEHAKQILAEKIGDTYVPKNLGEAFTELDRMLPEVERKEMAALPKREDMIRYHMGLGRWMRNEWGLWGGSRLQSYFAAKGVRHPEEMSSVILYGYHDWLRGDKEAWKAWEKNPK